MVKLRSLVKVTLTFFVDPACKGLPERLGAYHSLYPLENEQPNSPLSRTFGVPTTTYKGLSIRDGLPYAIR